MNFTNRPYERMMKQFPRNREITPQKAPKGSPCAGCSYWRGIACVFCYRKHLEKTG